MLEEEYAPRRVKPFHLRRLPPPEPEFTFEIRPGTEEEAEGHDEDSTETLQRRVRPKQREGA